MGGNSGNEANKMVAQAAQVSPPVPTQPAQVQNFAAFSPGQQGLLAQQMAQGFGGTMADHMNAMSFYKPTQVPIINTPSDLEAYLAQLRQSGQLAAAPVTQSSSSVSRSDQSDEGRSAGENRYGRYR